VKLGLIYARARNGVIGRSGGLPWHLPEDLAHFKRVTLGCPVIMGRRTWESIPERFRPLPGRANIVVTRQSDWHATGAVRAGSLEDAIAHCLGQPLAWVIGGAQLYAQALDRADIAEVTEIDADYDGDAFAPELSAQWRETARETRAPGNEPGLSFVTYHNTSAGG
jgi:dihydrofolate reductase